VRPAEFAARLLAPGGRQGMRPKYALQGHPVCLSGGGPVRCLPVSLEWRMPRLQTNGVLTAPVSL
jgi:hypothetical protein